MVQGGYLNGCFILEDADKMLLVSYTRYLLLDAEGTVSGLFAVADDSFDYNISNYIIFH